MSAETQKGDQRSMKSKTVWVGIIICLAVWAAGSTLRSRGLQQREELSRQRMDLIKLQQYLLLPSELIYCDADVIEDGVTEARIKSFESRGVESFLPYRHVIPTWKGFGNELLSSEGRGGYDYATNGFERELSEACFQACLRLTHSILNNQGMGLFLIENPEIFEAHIRPLVIRLIDAYDPWFRIQACEVLLAMGDRSEEVLEILQLASMTPLGSSVVPALIEKHGLALEMPDEVPSQKELLPLWKRTHEIANELKKQYPLLPRATVIHDWEGYCYEGRDHPNPWPIFD